MEPENFEQLMKQYLSPVYNFIYRLTGDIEPASDLTQETFVKVWKNLKHFDQTRNFKPWLFAIARHTTIDWLRKHREIPFADLENQTNENNDLEDNLPDSIPLPDELFHRQELGNLLERALTTLPINDRSIILLHHLESLTFAEIAKMFNQPMNTVKSRYRRALRALRQFLVAAPK